MFSFKIFEIPEGRSERTLELNRNDLDLGDTPFKGGRIYIQFDRSLHFIRTKLDIDVDVELVCDRSLDVFDYTVKQPYDILFNAEKIEESADENGALRNFDHGSKQINIEQDVRDTILVSLPVKKLHPRYLDENGNPKEFEDRRFGSVEDENSDGIDPRWEALKDLKNK